MPGGKGCQVVAVIQYLLILKQERKTGCFSPQTQIPPVTEKENDSKSEKMNSSFLGIIQVG